MNTEPDFTILQARLGAEHTRRRISRQTTHIARIFGGGRVRVHIENMTWMHGIVAVGLRLAGLHRRARSPFYWPIRPMFMLPPLKGDLP